MKTYSVTLQRTITITATTTVQALNWLEAETDALAGDPEDLTWEETRETDPVCVQVEEIAPTKAVQP